MNRLFLCLAILLLAVAPALAQNGGPKIAIEHAWARATPGKIGGVFMTIVNKGSVDDRMIAAETPVAAKAELHRTIEEKGVMEMRPVPALEVKAGVSVELRPGSFHVMLFGLKEPLTEGRSFPLTLTFEKAGKVETTVSVEKAGAMGDMPGMKM
jgi:periplasmic copper chaperone A